MHQTSYTRAEARAKVGRRVCTHMALDGIPQGTVGTVKRVDRVIDGYDLEIAWAVPERRRPMVGWYTRTDYEGSVVELDEGPRGRGELIRRRAHQPKASTPPHQPDAEEVLWAPACTSPRHAMPKCRRAVVP